MYIAFKWLLCLSLALWIALWYMELLAVESVIARNNSSCDATYASSSFDEILVKVIKSRNKYKFQNETKYEKQKMTTVVTTQNHSVEIFNVIMFVSGATVVLAFQKKKKVIKYLKTDAKSAFINYSKVTADLATYIFIKTSLFLRKTIIELCNKIYSHVEIKRVKDTLYGFAKYNQFLPSFRHKICSYFWKDEPNIQDDEFPPSEPLIFAKLEKLVKENRHKNALLSSAIKQNDLVKNRFILERMSRTRLLKTIEEMKASLKESRSKFIDLQKLYLVTHQENIFLKVCIKNLSKDKEQSRKNLLKLIGLVYNGHNSDLIKYCSQFVTSKDSSTFMPNTSECAESVELKQSKSSISAKVCENIQTGESTILVESKTNISSGLAREIEELKAQKVEKIPGECIWMVKNDDGLIEKIYAFDCKANHESGDVLRRIREYTVYCDKDCILDYQSSDNVLSAITIVGGHLNRRDVKMNGRFLTGSAEFRKFLEQNQNVVPVSQFRTASPLLMCR